MNPATVYAVAALAAAATLYGAIRFFGQRAHAPDAEEPPLEIVSRTRVAAGGFLVVVRYEGRRILLGVTRGRWTALADLGRAPEAVVPGTVIDRELNRAIEADRLRRGRRGSAGN
jgi:flagellar biogenesis protein FliO